MKNIRAAGYLCTTRLPPVTSNPSRRPIKSPSTSSRRQTGKKNTVRNQSTVLSLAPQATSRTNTIYMVTYFAGGALGSYTGGLAWHHFGWPGVTALGLLYSCAAVFVRFTAWMPATAGVIKRA
jgi:hypothetical protein